MSEDQLFFKERAKHVNLSKVGADTTYDVPVINDIEFFKHEGMGYLGRHWDDLRRWAVTQALMDNLSNIESGLSLRWLLPDYDFVDSYGDQITTRDWWLPANGRTFQPDPDYIMPSPLEPKYKDPENPTESEARKYKEYIEAYYSLKKDQERIERERYSVSGRYQKRQTVLESNTTVSRNDRKVILLFGVGRAMDSPAIASSMVIRRGNSTYWRTTNMVVSLEHLPLGKAVAFDRPFLAKRNDDFGIILTLPEHGWKEKQDHIILFGFVCTGLGLEQTG